MVEVGKKTFSKYKSPSERRQAMLYRTGLGFVTIILSILVLARWALSSSADDNTTRGKIAKLFRRHSDISLTDSQTIIPAVRVDVYVESLCIDSKNYVTEQLLPTLHALGPTVMDLTMVMFGNAKLSADHQGYDCQHGVGECDANVYGLCAIDLYRSFPSQYLPYVACVYETLPMGRYDEKFSKALFGICADETGLSAQMIRECHADDAKVKSLLKNAEAATPKHTNIPWVLVNGVENHVSPLLDLVCEAYTARGGSHPKCGKANKSAW
jgi:Gamma interferon inducible lysosomal thiol reductase (GILT)